MASTAARTLPTSDTYTDADQETLVRIIKEVQRRRHGDFPAWLKEHTPLSYKERRFGDPEKHAAAVLGAYVDGVVAAPSAAGKLRKLIKRHQDHGKQLKAIRGGECSLDPARHKLDLAAEVGGAMELVYKTQQHEDYARAYHRLPSYAKHWRHTRWTAPAKLSVEGKKKFKPRLLAMDCEMCETSKGTRELLGEEVLQHTVYLTIAHQTGAPQVSVTDDKGNALLKTLVKPRGTVIDLRTDITGITLEHLANVTTTCHDVRRQVRKLCMQDGGAIMVGHSLNHDLMAMRLNHQLVIDTALLFQYQGLVKCTPSLADLALQVLGKQIRVSQSEHDSMEDAATSMDLVLHALQHGVNPVVPPEVKVSKEMLCKLFVHSLPASSTAADVTALFSRVAGCPVPTGVEGPTVASGKRIASAQVVFATATDANLAFKKLPCFTRAGKDNRGRPQKAVLLHEEVEKPAATRSTPAAAASAATPSATPSATAAAPAAASAAAAASATPASAPRDLLKDFATAASPVLRGGEVDTTGMKASEARKARRAVRLGLPVPSAVPSASAPSANGALKASESRAAKRQRKGIAEPKGKVTIMVRKNACHGGVMFAPETAAGEGKAAAEDTPSKANGDGDAAGKKRKPSTVTSSPFSRPAKRAK